MPSDALPSYDDDDGDDGGGHDDVIAHNERKRTPRGRRHIYTENYVSDDQNNGKLVLKFVVCVCLLALDWNDNYYY